LPIDWFFDAPAAAKKSLRVKIYETWWVFLPAG
jgi:hypothetical protein